VSFHSRRFGRAADTYGAHAGVQERMADVLVSLIPETSDLPGGPGTGILEMGCGTGLLTARLRGRLPDAPLLATDASDLMLERARTNLEGTMNVGFALQDASGNVPVSQAVASALPFGLAASNALVQWFPAAEGLSEHLRMVAGTLRPRGVYVVSGFSRDNFPELNALLRERPFGYADFPGHGPKEIEQAAQEAGFSVESFRNESLEVEYDSVEGFLAVIRGLGSSRRPGASVLTRTRLELLVDRYRERYSTKDGGAKATWMPWFSRLRLSAP
jgi:SAM-dependent methyltransferase